MLVNWSAPQHVYIVCGKTDLRKGIDGLAMVIAENYDSELEAIIPLRVTLEIIKVLFP